MGLREQEWVTAREARMLLAAVDRQVLDLPVAERDRMRARLLSAMIVALITVESEEAGS
jgi:transcriptional regulator CtsR